MEVLAFGEFEADPERFELRRKGVIVEISARCFDVLLYLIRNRERVVSKAELLEKVWKTQSLSTSAVPTSILALRKVLGDEEDSARHIANLRGRGYRFVASVILTSPAPGLSSVRAGADPLKPPSGVSFVGRGSELAAIEAAFARSMTGAPQLVLLSGEAGIGKTRTAEEFGLRAQHGGAWVLAGHCREGAGAPAFWPWVQIVRSIFDTTEPIALARDLVRLAPVMAQMVPEIADRISAMETPRPLGPDQARFRLFDTIASVFQRVSSARPLVIVIDDLHRGDAASLQLLAFLAREMRDARVLFFATYRDLETQFDEERLSVITELARLSASRSLQLNGLSAQEVAQLVSTSRLCSDSGELLARTLHEQSGGNPFFLTQLMHVLEVERESNLPGPHKIATRMLPGGVREAISRQVDGLPNETREVLRAAATAGREFSAVVVSDVLGLSLARLVALLTPALNARIVTPAALLTHFRFAHVLLRDAIYDEIAPFERGALHLRIARVLERIYADDLGPRSAELAYHFLEAIHHCGTEPAVHYAVLAGGWSTTRLAYEDAAHHYRNALAILEHSGPGNSSRRCEVLLSLGEVEMHSGEREQSIRTHYEAAALAKRAGHAELLARAALRLAPGFFTIEVGVFDSLLVDLLHDAIAAIGAADTSLRAQLLARLAMAHAWSGAEDYRSQLTTNAIAVAERIGEPGSIAYALAAKHGLLWGPERLPERVVVVDAMGPLAARANDTELILMHLLFRITANLELGRMSDVDRDISRYSEIAEGLNRPQSLWYVHAFRTARAVMQGRFVDAAQSAQEMLSIGARVNDVNSLNTFGLHAAIQLWEQGRASEILPFAEQYIARYPLVSAWQFSSAAMHFEAGRVGDARSRFEHLARNEFASIPKNEQWSISTCLAADLCCWLDDSDRAEILYHLLYAGREYYCVVGFGIANFGSFLNRLAGLAAVLGKWDLAEEHFEAAIRAEDHVGSPTWMARAIFGQATSILRRGKKNEIRRAKVLLERAREVARAIGMNNLMQRIDQIDPAG